MFIYWTIYRNYAIDSRNSTNFPPDKRMLLRRWEWGIIRASYSECARDKRSVCFGRRYMQALTYHYIPSLAYSETPFRSCRPAEALFRHSAYEGFTRTYRCNRKWPFWIRYGKWSAAKTKTCCWYFVFSSFYLYFLAPSLDMKIRMPT